MQNNNPRKSLFFGDFLSKNGDFDTIATIQSTVFYWWSAYSVGGAFGGGFGGTLENLIGPISFPPT